MSEVKFDFTDKRFVVTGASSGMGRQVVVELAHAGAKVLALARRLPELKQLRDEFPQSIEIASVDVCDKKAVEEAIRIFVEENGKLNGSIHAAGIVLFTPLRGFDMQAAKKIFDVSFWAGIELLQIVTKKKYADAGTSNILFSSVSSYSGEKGRFAYSAAKAGLRIAIKSIVKEISYNKHRLNTVSPGWVKTNMTEEVNKLVDDEAFISKHLLGTGKPEDVSGIILFLLSDRASWITGTDVIVDGGYLA